MKKHQKVTAEQITAARATVRAGNKIVSLGGRTAASEEELDAIVSALANAGRVEGTEKESPAAPVAPIGALATGPVRFLNRVGFLKELTPEQIAEIEASLANLQPDGELIHLPSVELPLATGFTLEWGPSGTPNEGMVREIHVSEWRLPKPEETPGVIVDSAMDTADKTADAAADPGDPESDPEDASVEEPAAPVVDPSTPSAPSAPSSAPVTTPPAAPEDQQQGPQSQTQSQQSELPADFPAREQLTAAEVLTLDQLRAIPAEALTKIPGITQNRAGKIIAALEKLQAHVDDRSNQQQEG